MQHERTQPGKAKAFKTNTGGDFYHDGSVGDQLLRRSHVDYLHAC